MLNEFINVGYLSQVTLITSGGKTIDISLQVKEISIIESLFSNYINGTMVIRDIPETRLIQDGMVTAKDKIIFEFAGKKADSNKSPEDPIKIELSVYKLETKPEDGYARQMGILYLVSDELFLNNTKEISRSFEGRVSDLAQTICDELKITNVDIEPTEDFYKFISIYKSPFELLNFLTTKAIPKRNKYDMNYVFYQDIDRKYHFRSIGSLYEAQPKVGTNVDDGFVHLIPVSDWNDDLIKRMVLQFQATDLSALKNAMGGMYTSQIFTTDTRNKSYTMTTFNMKNVFDKQTHLSNDEIILNDISDEKFKKTLTSAYLTRNGQLMPYCYDCERNKGFQDKIGGPQDIVLLRLNSMEQLNQLGITIKINGNSTLRAGDVIYFGRPIEKMFSSEKPYKDILYSGKYMILDIIHNIVVAKDGVLTEYTTTLKAIKDSIGEE